MRIAVAGATGNIGARTASFLERSGHEVMPISRSLGVDLITGRGLDAALRGVDAVVDAISSPPVSPDETLAYFGTATRNLLAAEERAGVRHHVLLSIVGIHRITGGTAHYSGKREQERLVEEGRVPWTIVPATQFHDFGALAASWTERDGVATIAPLLVQPIAPDDIAQVLAEVATGEPQGRYVDVAGPDPQDLVDMARRTNDVLGRKVKLVPTWSGPLDESMAGNVLLPGENARIAPTTFDQWLAAGVRQEETMDPYAKAKNTRTDLQSITPPFVPAEAEVMTVRIEYPPGDPGVPPHRHPGGPCFGYILEGEMVFEVQGEPPRVVKAGEAFWEPGGDAIHYQDANNRTDSPLRFVVTMLMARGQPMLVFLDDDELQQSAWVRRSPA